MVYDGETTPTACHSESYGKVQTSVAELTDGGVNGFLNGGHGSET